MRCAASGTDNEPGRKFCGECGSPLAVSCPTCGTANNPGAKFCGEYGTQLAGTAASPTTAAGRQPETATARADGRSPRRTR